MDFYKYQGAGNDFAIVDNMDLKITNRPVLANHICDRHYGVGADGFIAAEPSKSADIKMAFYNADGSEAGMCGNGIRCFAKFVKDRKIVDKDSFTVETGDGVKTVEILESATRATNVKVNMGQIGEMKEFTLKPAPRNGILPPDLPKDQEFDLVFTHLGVPHAVIFNDQLGDGMKGLDHLALTYGYSIEHAPQFALDGTNVNFVSVVNDSHILCSTWERGAGKTLACGTGACSSAAVARAYKKLGDSIKVTMPGGEVVVTFEGDQVFMQGRAVLTFVGSAPGF
ncbi:MAG: diaminopimelate epimerase [Anaerovoracaceae bacterium]|nr:diaminopimelate epimerase [Bacillota bacterium]MDY2671316.1 diaminopimelate epimerase [Anaerovoracaceae bacterium]